MADQYKQTRAKMRAERRDWLSDSWSLPERTPFFSTAGPWVDTSSTLGLSTAGAAIQLVAETIGMMPLKVYRGEKPEQAEARDSWQWYRLKEAPNEEQSAFDFWQDAGGSIETAGNAFVWKAIARRPVRDESDIEFYLIDPANVFVKREKGKKYYEVRRNGKTERVPASQILHIRGWTSPAGSDVGLSPIALHRETIGAGLAARDYQSRFYSQGTSLPGFIVTPGAPAQADIDRLGIEWDQRHTGLRNAHRPGVLANGATWVPTGISQRDAQYIESQRFSAEEVARICRVTPGMLGIVPGGSGGNASANDDFDRFLQADIGPRIRRIEMALMRDADLFPSGGNLFPEFLTAAVLKPSLTTRFAAYKDALQGGWKTANEIRALENDPPKEGGDELQQTPVGGAPNTGAESVPSDA
jgi:HK97 family phage portal protein